MNKQTQWNLRDAKAHLGEVVRKAAEEGPQHVNVRGKKKAVVISVEEYKRLTAVGKPSETGARLVEIIQEPRIK